MSAKIYQFNQFKNVKFIDLIQQGTEMKFDVHLDINNFPFTLCNVSISQINKDKIRYNSGSIYHSYDSNNQVEICPFCGKEFNNSICDSLTKEKNEIFSLNISKEVFFPMMSYYYSKNEKSDFEELVKIEPNELEPLFYGLSEGMFIQCIFKYKNEILLFQDIANVDNTDVLPLIFFFNEEQKELNLYIEYLLPENLLPITSAINKHINAPNAQIFDTTGIGLKELYIDFLQKNN